MPAIGLAMAQRLPGIEPRVAAAPPQLLTFARRADASASAVVSDCSGDTVDAGPVSAFTSTAGSDSCRSMRSSSGPGNRAR